MQIDISRIESYHFANFAISKKFVYETFFKYIIFYKVQQLSVTFLNRNGEIEALLTHESNHGLCWKYRDASANDDRCRRGIADISLRRLLLRLSYRHHGTLARLQSSVALREKLCIPRVRGCTLPANGLWNFTRHVPFLHFIAASIHEYAKLTQVLRSWNTWDADDINHYYQIERYKYIIDV